MCNGVLCYLYMLPLAGLLKLMELERCARHFLHLGGYCG